MTNIPKRSSDIKQLNKLVQVMLQFALDEIRKQGVNPLVVETYRTQERQNYLYCQGRTVTECVARGIKKAYAVANCSPNAGKKTGTLSSEHTKRKAVDIVPQRRVNGKMTAIWNTNDPQTQIIIKTMEKYGFEPGAYWKTFTDSTHFQVKGDFTNIFDSKHTTLWVTAAVQRALGIRVNKLWDAKTIVTVNSFRKAMGYKTARGQLGKTALRALFLHQSK